MMSGWGHALYWYQQPVSTRANNDKSLEFTKYSRSGHESTSHERGSPHASRMWLQRAWT